MFSYKKNNKNYEFFFCFRIKIKANILQYNL